MQRNGTQRHAGEETGQNSNATKPADRAGRHMRWHGQMCDLDQPNSTLRTPLLVLHPVPFFLAGRWTLDHPGISPIPLPPGGSSSSRRVGLWVKAWRAYVVHHALRAFPYGCSTTTTHGGRATATATAKHWLHCCRSGWLAGCIGRRSVSHNHNSQCES